jgi:hypothetical protein
MIKNTTPISDGSWSQIGTVDPNTYLINNTANQTLSSIQIGAQKQNHNIVFHGPNGKEVGRFDFNGNELHFDGNADISAQVFIEWATRNWHDRLINEKLDVIKQVTDALLHEATGALYEDAEKLAILTCLQRVREIQQLVKPAQEEMWGASIAGQQALQPVAPWSSQP